MLCFAGMSMRTPTLIRHLPVSMAEISRCSVNQMIHHRWRIIWNTLRITTLTTFIIIILNNISAAVMDTRILVAVGTDNRVELATINTTIRMLSRLLFLQLYIVRKRASPLHNSARTPFGTNILPTCCPIFRYLFLSLFLFYSIFSSCLYCNGFFPLFCFAF